MYAVIIFHGILKMTAWDTSGPWHNGWETDNQINNNIISAGQGFLIYFIEVEFFIQINVGIKIVFQKKEMFLSSEKNNYQTPDNSVRRMFSATKK